MCTQIPQAGSRIHDLILNASSGMSYGRAPRAVVLGAALALLLFGLGAILFHNMLEHSQTLPKGGPPTLVLLGMTFGL